MTQQQLETLAKAIARAHADGCRITGCGTIKTTGQRFYTVLGKTGAYVVLVGRSQLSCSCPARGLCKHRALVHEALAAERQAAQVAAQQAAKAEREREAAQVAAAARIERETAPLRRSNRPFSLWKS